MTDLVSRLRQFRGAGWETTECYNGLREEAAARIEALQAELAMARAPHAKSGELVKEVCRLMREDFDPTPPNWEGRDWFDNAEDVAHKIIATVSVSAADRIEALERALEAVGRFLDRVKVDAQMSGPVVMGLKRGVWAGRTIDQDWTDANDAIAALSGTVVPPSQADRLVEALQIAGNDLRRLVTLFPTGDTRANDAISAWDKALSAVVKARA